MNDDIAASDQIEPVLPAATVVLVRDGAEGMEALLVQRHKDVSHMGGMWVFPGGKVEAGDRIEDDDHKAAVNAAIRETGEEAGLTLAPEQLLYFSHWTTPVGAKRRFATWFFLALLEDGQHVEVDGGEIAHHRWVQPRLALAESDDPDQVLRLMPPTYVSLHTIADCVSCADARVRVGGSEPMIFEPAVVADDAGVHFLYTGDAGYESLDLNVPGPRHRLLMSSDSMCYVCEL
ncbi:MAG: NUDIX hydrolase [Pseudomonadota bacterium]